MNPEIDENEKIIQDLYDSASEDVKHVLQQVLEVEAANLHYKIPPEIDKKIVAKIKAKIVEDSEVK